MAAATPEQIAWAAGLFEGEGTMSTAKYKVKSSAQGYHLRFEMNIVMTDEDVVRKFHDIVGIGHVWLKRQTEELATKGRKLLWQWKASGPKAINLMWQLSPHLGSRRRLKFLDHLEKMREVRDD